MDRTTALFSAHDALAKNSKRRSRKGWRNPCGRSLRTARTRERVERGAGVAHAVGITTAALGSCDGRRARQRRGDPGRAAGAREAEIALRLDFKSMFVFGETLIASCQRSALWPP